MKTLEFTDFDSGTVIDRVTLSPDGKVSYDTGRAEPMIQTLVAQGLTPSQAFEARTGWSNGYITATLA